MARDALSEALRKLHTQMAISETEVDDRFRKAVDGEYWRTLSPGMGVMDRCDADGLDGPALSSEEETAATSWLAKLGYFQLSLITAPSVVDRMRRSVEAVRKAGWPAVFSYVYDEFWAILRTPSMVRFLSRQLGAGYVQTAPIWTHYVDPGVGASGWAPHADNSDRKNTEQLSIWIPLTDAAVGNGCMYLIAQDGIPPSLPQIFSDWTLVSKNELFVLLHNVVALPAPRGSVLGWNPRLIHWGGRAVDSISGPRVSFAVEFLRERTRPSQWELPVFGLKLPSLQARMRVIGQAILTYRKFEPLMHRYFDLACKLTEWGSSDKFVNEQEGILTPEDFVQKLDRVGP